MDAAVAFLAPRDTDSPEQALERGFPQRVRGDLASFPARPRVRGHPDLRGGLRLRCVYCETDIEDFVAANRRTRHYSASASAPRDAGSKVKEYVFLATAKEARERGYESGDASNRPRKRRKAG